jgi:hypothetical protein
VPAKHYGFTDEELDFIINYDTDSYNFSGNVNLVAAHRNGFK